MFEKQRRILVDIYSGKIKDVDDYEFSLKEYLAKDENGTTFIEHLLKNNIVIYNEIEKEKIKYSKEVAYLFCKYGYNLYNFHLSENDIFSYVNNEVLIDFFIKNHNLSSNIVNTIKSKVEILDLLAQNKNLNYLACYLSNDIIKIILEKNTNNNCILEKYFSNYELMKYIIPIITTPEIITLCNKHNKYEYLKHAHESILLFEINDNKTLLEELLSKNITPDKLIDIPEDDNFIEFLVQKKLYKYFVNAQESILLTPLHNNKTVMEEIIKKGFTPKLEYINDTETIIILHKINKLYLIKNISDYLLEQPTKNFFEDSQYKDESLLEYLFSKKINPLKSTSYITNVQIIKILLKLEKYEIISKNFITEDILMKKIDNRFLIELLLEKNITPKISYESIEKIKIAKILLDYKRFDLLVKVPLYILMKKINNDNTYMDYILDKIKKDKFKFNLNRICLLDSNNETLSKFYLCVANHNMVNYIKPLSVNTLLREDLDSTLIQKLFEKDAETTINKLIPKEVKRDPKIALLIKSKGYEQNEINVIEKFELYSENILKNIHEHTGIGPQLNEGQVLLEKLAKLFYYDQKSDPKLIDALIIGYRMALIENYNNAVNELKKLIMIKENNYETFTYERIQNGAYFEKNKIFCDYAIIETLFHETGHALHSYLTNFDIPNNFQNIVEKLRNNPELLIKTELFTQEHIKQLKKIQIIIEKLYNNFFEINYTIDKEIAIKKYLKEIKIQKKEEFKNLNISEEELDKFLEEAYIVDNYLEHEKRLFFDELKEILMEKKYPEYSIISDILDAIYEGKLKDGLLKNKDGLPIPKTTGHGMEYYYDSIITFDEMIANFATLIKNHNSYENLELLKSIIGDELYSLLNEFYHQNFILNNKKR